MLALDKHIHTIYVMALMLAIKKYRACSTARPGLLPYSLRKSILHPPPSTLSIVSVSILPGKHYKYGNAKTR